MKKKLLSVLMVLVILTSFINTTISVKAAPHTHNFNIFVSLNHIGDGYDSSGHYWKTTSVWACSCGARMEIVDRKFEGHSLSHTNYHHGSQHTFGHSCGVCGWSNVTTYPCPGGSGGPCITPYSLPTELHTH